MDSQARGELEPRKWHLHIRFVGGNRRAHRQIPRAEIDFYHPILYRQALPVQPEKVRLPVLRSAGEASMLCIIVIGKCDQVLLVQGGLHPDQLLRVQGRGLHQRVHPPHKRRHPVPLRRLWEVRRRQQARVHLLPEVFGLQVQFQTQL